MTINSTFGPNGYEVSIPAPVSGGGITRWGVLGDSISAQGFVKSGVDTYYSADGYWCHALIELGWPVDSVTVAATGGHTTAQMLARIDVDLAGRNIQACWVLGGQNDSTSAETIANLGAIYSKLTGMGITVFATPILGTDQSESVLRRQAVSNAWIRSQHNGTTVFVTDADRYFRDPATGVPKTDYTRETSAGTRIHPSVMGAREIGRMAARAVPTRMIAKQPIGIWRPRGGYASNPFVAGSNASGTNGFTAQAGVTGVGPDTYDIAVRNTGAAAASKVSLDVDGRLHSALRVAFTSTSAYDGISVRSGGSPRSGVASGRYDLAWTTGLAVIPGLRRRPTVFAGYVFTALSSGTTTTEPTWIQEDGAITVDAAGISWICTKNPVNGDQFYAIAEIYVPPSVAIVGGVTPRLSIECYNRNVVLIARGACGWIDLSGVQGKAQLTMPSGVHRLVTPIITLSGLNTDIAQLDALRYLYAELSLYGNGSSSATVDVLSMDIVRVTA